MAEVGYNKILITRYFAGPSSLYFLFFYPDIIDIQGNFHGIYKEVPL